MNCQTLKQVAEVAVVGQIDAIFGEIVTAIVVQRQPNNDGAGGKSSDDLDQHHLLTADLKDFLKSRMAMYKQPRKYHIVETIPRNLMGKVS
jgi:acyl-coenzyme A synthetase/AMP-(fatty) acid ligase